MGLAQKIVELESQVNKMKNRVGQLEKKSSGQADVVNLLQLDSEINLEQTKKSKKQQESQKKSKKPVKKKVEEEENSEENDDESAEVEE